jgi:hypothetical protein
VTFTGLLSDVIGRMDRADIPYMVTGSLASSYHGEPRATRDLDLVIDPTSAALALLVDDLSTAGYYVDAEAARAALHDRSQFNAISPDVTKVDFIIRKQRPFSIEEFSRRERADLLGTTGFVATLEDLVIAKLEWAVASDSDRQRRDVLGMLRMAVDLDEAYIDRWTAELGLRSAWRSIRDQARSR